MGSTYDREKPVSDDVAESFRDEILDFISGFNRISSFLLTFRKDGSPIMRPVSTFVENWMVGTITQDLHVKTQHVRNDPRIGYLWVGEGRNGMEWARKHVWLEGRSQLIEDPDDVEAFFQRRKAATGQGDVHVNDPNFKRLLIRTTPKYLRAEGFAGGVAPVIYRSFPGITPPTN
jgi:hypothetical protein